MSVSGSVRTAGAAVLDDLLTRLRTEKGFHLESAAVALGALAGHACQVVVLAGGPAFAGLSMLVASGADGDEYYFGDAINRPLAESPDSVWELVSTKARALGSAVPDRDELFRHAAETVGGPDFGIPRYAPGTFSEPPTSFLPLWDTLQPTVTAIAPDPRDWPTVYAVALCDLLDQVNGQFDLEPLVRIAMDSAVATSKLKSP